MALASIYQEIWQKAQPLLAKGRFYDLLHTEIAISHMQTILTDEGKKGLENVLLPAIILHDIGWSVIGEEKNSNWSNHNLRIQHMKEGAQLAQQVLNNLQYNHTLTSQIVELVATHDNEYLGIKPKTQIEKLLRDADACFIFTDLSFWKDYTVKNKGESPTQFLTQQINKYGKRYSTSAQHIIDREIEVRKLEIEDTSQSPEQRFRTLQLKALSKNSVHIGHSSFTRINIAIQPPLKIRKHILSLSQQIAKSNDCSFTLDEKNFYSHITLYSPEYPTENIANIWSVVDSIVNKTSPFEVHFSSFETHQGYIGLLLHPSKELIELHEQITRTLNSLRDGHLREKYTIEKQLIHYSEPQLDYIKNWGYPEVFSEFKPHITLSHLKNASLAQSVIKNLGSFPEEKWQVTGLTAFTMGSYGTCNDILKTFTFSQ